MTDTVFNSSPYAKMSDTDKLVMEETIEYLLHAPDMGNEIIAAGAGIKQAKARIISRVRNELSQQEIHGDRQDRIIENLVKFMWGYYILEPLIDEELISDIRVMDYDRIAVCCNGIYTMTGLSFESREEYNSFVQSLAVTNQISLADVNAIQIVTDKSSNENWIMRIAVATGFLNTEGTYFLHIRKHPKKKKKLEDLVAVGMIPQELLPYLRENMDRGLLVAGRTGSGKTHFLNAMIELIPEYETGICVQEAEELFSEKKSSLLAFLHVVMKRGEGRIKYDLEDLSKFALLTGNKYFIIGEIKGDEAAYFANACYTGSVPWTTVHGESSREAIDKLCDYIMRSTGYEHDFVMKMLKSLKTVIYMENYKICEVSEVEGFDEKSGSLIYRPVYDSKNGGIA